MNRSRQLIVNLILFLVLIAFLVKYFGIIEFDANDIIAFGLMSYGIVSVYFSLGTHRRGHLFINTVLFLIGIVVYVLNHYNFMSAREVILPAILFLIGSGFLMLFIDDSTNRVFLISAIVLLVSFGLYVWFGRTIRILSFANRFTGILLDYYPIFIILAGIIILLNRKRRT